MVTWQVRAVQLVGRLNVRVYLVQHEKWISSRIGLEFGWLSRDGGWRSLWQIITITPAEANELGAALWEAIRIAKGEKRVVELSQALEDLKALELAGIKDEGRPARESMQERVERLRRIAAQEVER